MNTWTRPELISQLQEAFAGFLGMDPAEVDPERSIDELGMASLTAAQAFLDLHRQLGGGQRETLFTIAPRGRIRVGKKAWVTG